MIEIQAKADRFGRYSVTVQGHAEKSRECCAAVSAIMVALQGWMENDLSPAERSVKIESGLARLEWRSAAPRGADVYDMATIGLLAIAGQYPDEMKMTLEEDRTNAAF